MKQAFLLFISLLPSALVIAAEQHCEEKLVQAICVVDPPASEPDRYKPSRPCLSEETRAYGSAILEAYRSFPKLVKTALCSVQNLYIEKQFFGTAWSAPVNENAPQSMLLGLNKREMDAQLKLEPFSSWFEQLSFGGPKDFTVSPLLPTIAIEPRRWKSATYLIDTLLHEAGHLLDYKYGFNKFICSSPNMCKPAPGSWTEIAWLSSAVPRPENDFDQRRFICINNCQSTHLDPKKSAEFYEDLHKSGFVSQLSAISPLEDFAETFSLYVKIHVLGQQIHWRDSRGNIYDAKLVLNSMPLKQKITFLESHLKELK